MILIKNGYIKPMVGEDIANGSVLIGDDGKIIAVGENIEAPAGAEIIDAEGRLVTPGCVEAHCHIGLHNEAVGWEGRDFNESVDPLTPHMRAIDSINPQDEAFLTAIRGGVTTACTGPGSANVVGGTFAVIKLVGNRVDNMIVKHPAAMKCAFGENPKRVYGQGGKKSPVTRMATAALLRELLFKSRRYLADKEAGKDPFDMKLEAMIPVMKGEIPLKAHAHRADDILTSIRIAKEFGIKLTLDHCTDGSIIA
ncbi:MAG: amidohydrolase, partial [Clostridia bacterium]|nr:amidohydrolase [Clostridia bacterium]